MTNGLNPAIGFFLALFIIIIEIFWFYRKEDSNTKDIGG